MPDNANLNTTETGKSPAPGQQFRDGFSRMEGEIKAALPPHVPVERFMRVVLTAVNGNPDLLKADRRSLFESAMKAAQDGLLPDGRDGALVVFNTKVKGDDGRDKWIAKVQWMPMVGGILKKVRNSGELLSVSAHVAYEYDKFFYRLGDEERIDHEPLLDGPRGNPKLVYAVAKTKDGGIYREVMTVSQVEQVRNVSRAKNAGPWTQWWDEMAKKTVIKRLAKRLPTSADLDDLLRRDDDLYDFSGKRAEVPEGFSPVANPLQDHLAVEHRGSENPSNRDDRQNENETGEPPRSQVSPLTEGYVVKGGHNSGPSQIKTRPPAPAPMTPRDKDRGNSDDGAPWEEREDHISTGRSEPENDFPGDRPLQASEKAEERAPPEKGASAPGSGKNAPSGSASPATARPAQFEDAEDYVAHMRDAFDAATSKTAVNDEWARTRTFRTERLSAEQVAELTDEKKRALARFERRD